MKTLILFLVMLLTTCPFADGANNDISRTSMRIIDNDGIPQGISTISKNKHGIK